MKQKVASGSNKGQGQRPAWQHRFVAAAGILTRLISVRGCQSQGSPCVCVVSSHGWTMEDDTELEALYSTMKRKQIAERSKWELDFTPHHCEWSRAESGVLGTVKGVHYRSHLPAAPWFYYYQHWCQSHEHGSLGWETFRWYRSVPHIILIY